MASSNFDELAKALATSTSRRQTIKVLFASALGGTLSFGSIGAVQAAGEDCGGSPDTDPCGAPTDDFGIWNKIKDCVDGNPCSAYEVDTSHTPPQWVLFQEHNNPTTNYTLFAGQRIKGIECPKIWENTDPNYWEFAWNAAKNHLDHLDRIGLAINSKGARTQCQLHIHVSCIQTDVQKQLENNDSLVAEKLKDWKAPEHTLLLNYEANGMTKTHIFRVLKLNLDRNFLYYSQNLFQLLQHNVVSPNGEDMADQTLIVTVRPGGGFYILNSMPSLMIGGVRGTGGGEELLDEMCSM